MSTDASVELIEVPVVDAIQDWTVIGAHTGEAPGWLDDVSSAAVVREDWHRIGDAVFPELVVARSDGTRDSIVLREEQIIQRVFLAGEDVFFGASVDRTGEYVIYLWRAGTSEPTELLVTPGDGELPVFWPLYAAQGTRAVVTTWDGTHSCVESWDLASADPAATAVQLGCGGSDEFIDGLEIDADGTVSYVPRPAEPLACGTLHSVESGSSVAEPVVEAGCVVLGAANSEVVTWVRPYSDANWDHTMRYAITGGELRSLGDTQAAQASWCGGALYWATASGGSEQPAATVRRWTPGGNVEVIYRGEKSQSGFDTAQIGWPVCMGTTPLITVFDDVSYTYLALEDPGWRLGPATEPEK